LEQVDALTDLSDGDHAQMQEILRGGVHPPGDTPVWPNLHELGDRIRVEQKPTHAIVPAARLLDVVTT
jgi:hypothetical protein